MEKRRVVANIYEDTRGLLNGIKDRYKLNSDDQAVKFLCQSFESGTGKDVLEVYLKVKSGE